VSPQDLDQILIILETEVLKSRLEKPAKLLKVRGSLVEELQELDDEEGEGGENQPVKQRFVVEGRVLFRHCYHKSNERSNRRLGQGASEQPHGR